MCVLRVPIHQNYAFHSALHEHVRVGLKLIALMVVDTANKKVVVLPQKFFNSRDDQRGVGITQIVGDNSQSISALFAERTSQQIGTIVKLSCRGMNAITRSLRNMSSRRRII